MQARLAETHFGRILLHLFRLVRDDKVQWHWQGVVRELSGSGESGGGFW
jgi:hypothetical protein